MKTDDPALCLEHCLYPFHSDCPDYCPRHGKPRGKRQQGMALLRAGKSPRRVAALCKVELATVRKWEKELIEEEENG